MSADQTQNGEEEAVAVLRGQGAAGVVLVCEHAANVFPQDIGDLDVPPEMRSGHAAWDPGALGVATGMSERLDAPLVAGRVSRLIYDCNRPPEAETAILQQSEGMAIPGNIGLSPADRAARVTRYYLPFEAALHRTLDRARAKALVTIHSFTPVFMGKRRDVALGVLHDSDTRLADAMLACAGRHTDLRTERNAPYGPQDGVTHTLRLHGLARGIPNVMLEVRNDLISSPVEEAAMAAMLSGWLMEAMAAIEVPV
ncbi:N-formylglutamate amidohydrolase [uncultured Roseobacter sp.]|uniref:N-formylglutamate amidohydrolase n=1 Tax=uncultured Roseobacter sp. TaxID=114847 RepID=UPI00260BCDC7|nr:N-formylglutamate amidohydrolase [uncultured Roseobacter sp.]